MDSNVSNFLITLIYSIPTFLIYFTGLILSFILRKRLGRVWLVPVFAFLIFILLSLAGVGLQIFFHFYIVPEGSYSFYAPISKVYGFISMAFEIIAFILLLIAIFAKRNTGPDLRG